MERETGKSKYMKSIFYGGSVFCILLLSACKKDATVQNNNVFIGGLLSVTGNWSSLGVTSQEAMHLAASDINSYMIQTGSGYRFSTTIYDTKLDTSLAVKAISDGMNAGIKYFIGPQSSAELETVRSFANNNNLLVVSTSSTAGSLAITGDAVFRFCPGDVVEGGAVAKTIFASGRTNIITMARDDAGNKGLQQSVGNVFSSLGGIVDAMTPYAINTTDFSAVLANLKSKLQQLVATAGADKTGIYLASFDECVDLFKQAKTDPLFSSVRWYGGDGVVLSNSLVSDNQAASFAAGTNFFAPNFGLPLLPHPNLSAIAAAIKTKTGIEPDAYALAAYDAMWVIARTVIALSSDRNDFARVKSVFEAEANRYFGITGPLLLNTAGDRSTGSFDYWGIVSEGGSYQWKLVGKSM